MSKRTPYYAGNEFARLSQHDGGLRHVVGASNYQVLRANRTNPQLADDFGYTYNHAPMLTFWKDRFYLQYLSNPVGEHQGPGHSLLCISDDGISWEKPIVSFPSIRIPAGSYHCDDGTDIVVPEEKDGFMHQRMAFYHSNDDRLLVSGFYGHAPHYDICPWGNYGMGRAIREVYQDGTLGPVYFIHYLRQSGWIPENLPFPIYNQSSDAGFVRACEELLADKLVTQQWSEEHGNNDPCISIKTPSIFETAGSKADGAEMNTPYESASSFCWYHIDETTIIALWKQSRVARSDDDGQTWDFCTEPSFATSGAKSWGQKTSDGRYAIAYDNSLSSEHRYPLVTVTSDDGIVFDEMACVFGEVPPKRYRGTYKDFGPQYIRGICEGHAQYPKDSMWLCHSVNKEDIAVTRIPVPIRRTVTQHIHDDFKNCPNGYIPDWNIYSTVWTPVRSCKLYDGTPCMRIADMDPCDYARAMRIFPESVKVSVGLDLMCAQSYEEPLYIELADHSGNTACRILIGDGQLDVRYASNPQTAFTYPVGVSWHHIELQADCENNTYEVFMDGRHYDCNGPKRFMQKVNSLERLVIRTKPLRYLPNAEIFSDQPDIPNMDNPVNERIYFIKNVSTAAIL